MLAIVYVFIALVSRFLPPLGAWPFHFLPVGAALLYFGARRPLRQMWLPVALFAASDILLDRFVYHYAFTADQAVSWIWYAAAIAIGSLLRARTTVPRLLGASLGISISFFVLSNLSVWLGGGMYPMTFSGLVACYTAAVPFFRNTLTGDLLFTAVLFGLPALARITKPSSAEVV